MGTRSRRVFVSALALLVVGSILTPAVLADSHEYRISVDGSVPIPEQTKEIDESGVDGEFRFDAIKPVDPGEEFTVEVDGVPDRESPTVDLKEIVDMDTLRDRDFEHLDEDGRATFDAPEDPGLYFLAVDTGTIESLYPIIVREYSVDVDWETVPDAAESGSEISVSATVTRSTNPEERQRVQYVDVVIADEEALHNETLPVVEVTETSFTVSGTVTIDEPSIPPGDDYSVYVAARGPEKLEGLRVPVGISEQRAFEVTERSTQTPTPSTTSTSPQSSATASTSSTTTPIEGTSTETPTSSEPPTGTDDTATVPDTLPTLQPTTGTLKPADESTPTETEGGILTPGGPGTESPGGETTTDGQPGFAVATVVLAILFAAALFRRR